MAQVSSIRRKLISVIMLTTTCALVLAGASIIIYELVTLPKAAQSNFVSLAKVVADNSTAALAFNDPKVANDVLSTLNSYSTNFVKMAALYTTNGNLYAHYPASVSSNSFPSSVGPDRMTFERPFFTIVREVSEKGSRSGTLYFKGDLTPLYRRIWLYSEIVMLVLVGSGLVAFLLSSLLQKRISRPITSLVQTARIISEQRDYTVRAVKHDQDELGVLTDAFNHMLTQIQERTGALTEKEERLRLALQGSQTGTWDWNLETGKITWDEFTYRLFGRQPGEFDGTFKQFLSFIVPTERENVSTSTLRAIEEKREFALECRILLPGGETRYMSVRGKPFNGPGGKAVRVTGVALDVTESKRAEERIKNLNADLEIRVQARTAELTAANREMEAFTYSVAHDLRAPLRHVDGYTQMLQDELGTNLPGEAVEWAKRIRAATQNMGQLVDDLLNLARVGRQELVRRPANIKALVDEAIKTLQPEVNGRTVEWRVGSLPEWECDAGLMRQVFSNLLSNAVKYTRPRAKAVIEIGCSSDAKDGPAIFVRDNGVGFNMKYADKLFGVFQRLHRAEEFEGTGVGLATVERIIRKHGGRVWAESEVDRGASFYFTLQSNEPLISSSPLSHD